MINRLTISGFKRFTSCALDMAPLTVLTGVNGAGKTTVIQSLLLAREASLPAATTVPLNGPYGLALGSAQDVLNLDTALDASEIGIDLVLDDGTKASYRLSARDETLLHLPISVRPEKIPLVLETRHRSFTYLGAERLGPRDVLGASALPSDDLAVGPQGEFCAQVLAVHGLGHKVLGGRLHPERRSASDAFLKYQVEAWLSDIVRPIELDTVWFNNTSVTALRFRHPGGEWVRAPNMGFGVSYSLPIVLGGLFAPECNGLLLIENPEAHLHPAGQSRMGTFLAILAGSGVQIVVETHSDHVLNGIRRAIGEYQVLEAHRALVHFFDEAGSDGRPAIATLRFSATGSLSDWPAKFFDQYQLDVAALSRVRRSTRR